MNFTLKNLGFALAALTLAAPGWAGGDGSDGHTHAPQIAAAPLPTHTASPRMASATEQFELVGVLEGKVLTLYLDHFGTNAPVPKARIEIESGTWKAVATEVAPAVYTVAAAPLGLPGKYPLTITVRTDEATDLMDATLEVEPLTPADAGATHGQLRDAWATGPNAAALAAVVGTAAAAVLVLLRRRRQSRKHIPL